MHAATRARARQVVRSIDVTVRDVRWSDSGELVALIGEASFYVLRFSREAVDAWLAGGGEPDDDGVQDAFELLNEVSERVRTGAPARRCALCVRFQECVGAAGGGVHGRVRTGAPALLCRPHPEPGKA